MRERGLLLDSGLRAKSRVDEKTQTRRLMKPQPPEEFRRGDVAALCNCEGLWAIARSRLSPNHGCWPPGSEPGIKPQYQVGDHLYLQEPYQVKDDYYHFGKNDYTDAIEIIGDYCDDNGGFHVTLTDKESARFENRRSPHIVTSSRYMYKSLARTWFEVTDVRSERLQDISEADAIAEGVESTGGGRYWIAAFDQGFTPRATAREAVFDLWDSTNKIKAKQNPWVFPFTYKRIEKRGG